MPFQIHPQGLKGLSMASIFRSIAVGDDLQLALGEIIPPDVMNDMDKVPDHPRKYKFKSGEFSGAESITVTVDAKQLVQRMEFDYAAGTDYADMRENFINEIGQPDGGAAAIPDAQQQTVWSDPQTRFELYTRGSSHNVNSRLTDLANAPE